MRSRRQSKGKSIRPTFFVFCEGESEEAYVKFVRSIYRLPIEIRPSVAGLSISEESIKRSKRGAPTAEKDRDYLMYDLDRSEIVERLKTLKSAVLIGSNPCFELWYLLHFADQKAEMSSAQCLSSLRKHLPKYKKGEVCSELQARLINEQKTAVMRASALRLDANPSCGVPIFLADLERAK